MPKTAQLPILGRQRTRTRQCMTGRRACGRIRSGSTLGAQDCESPSTVDFVEGFPCLDETSTDRCALLDDRDAGGLLGVHGVEDGNGNECVLESFGFNPCITSWMAFCLSNLSFH